MITSFNIRHCTNSLLHEPSLRGVMSFNKDHLIRCRSGRMFSVETFSGSKEKVAKTYGWVFYNTTMTTASAWVAFQSGVASQIVDYSAAHPLIAVATGLVSTITPFLSLIMSDELQKSHLKKPALTVANVIMGIALSPLGFLGSEVLMPATTMTVGLSGALALAARVAPDSFSLKYRYPLVVGVGALGGCSVLSFALGDGTQNLAHLALLHGGFAVFGGLLVVNVQEVYREANEIPTYCPIISSVEIYCDVVNLFTRFKDFKIKDVAVEAAHSPKKNRSEVLLEGSQSKEGDLDRKFTSNHDNSDSHDRDWGGRGNGGQGGIGGGGDWGEIF